MVKFIHAADLHLDSPFKNLRMFPDEWQAAVLAAPAQSLNNLVELAIAEQVDFVLFTGDIYDSTGRSLQAQQQFIEACKKLEEAQVDVYLIHGNHDYMGELSETFSLQLPENVHVFKAEVETLTHEARSGEQVAISGFSYDRRHLSERMVPKFPERSHQADYHIGLYHGQVDSGMNPYAPFAVAEMQAKNYDYWALGHVHKREVLNEQPPIIYSGTTQGRNKNEGSAKGVYLVEMSTNQVQYEFVPTSAIEFNQVAIDLRQAADLSDIEAGIVEAVAEEQPNGILHLKVTVSQAASPALIDQASQPPFLRQLNQAIQVANPECFIASLVFLPAPEMLDDQLLARLYPESWEKALDLVMNEREFFNILSDWTDKYALGDDLFKDKSFRREILDRACLEMNRGGER